MRPVTSAYMRAKKKRESVTVHLSVTCVNKAKLQAVCQATCRICVENKRLNFQHKSKSDFLVCRFYYIHILCNLCRNNVIV